MAIHQLMAVRGLAFRMLFQRIIILFLCLTSAQAQNYSILAGRILNSDGQPPENGATIVIDCPFGTKIAPPAQADFKGQFRLEFDSDPAAVAPALLPPKTAPTTSGFCDIEVSAPGYHSRRITYHRSIGSGRGDIGIIVLNRTGVSSARKIHVTQLRVPNAGMRLYERGLKANASGDHRKAYEYFGRAALTYSGFSAAWVAKGHYEMSARRLADARYSFERAATAEPGSSHAAYGLATVCLAEGHWAQAEGHAEKAWRNADEQFAEPLHLLAIVRLRSGRIHEGVKLLERYIAHHNAHNREAARRHLRAVLPSVPPANPASE